jgi:hypothetical protein
MMHQMHGETNCTSSNESASVDAGGSSFPMPHLFEPSTRSSFEVSNILLSKGCAMIGPVVVSSRITWFDSVKNWSFFLFLWCRT